MNHYNFDRARRVHIPYAIMHKQKTKINATASSRIRGNHVKTQGLVKGTITVTSELSSHVSQGLFATPGPHDVAARYVNEPVFI